MRTLVVEDDVNSSIVFKHMLSPLGDCDVVMNGEDAVKLFQLALEESRPYDLILMDVMMRQMNGKEALTAIRKIEKKNGISGSTEVKVIMVTALGDPANVIQSYYRCGATSYIVKPLKKPKLMEELRNIGLLK